jgi:hypothetical protein
MLEDSADLATKPLDSGYPSGLLETSVLLKIISSETTAHPSHRLSSCPMASGTLRKMTPFHAPYIYSRFQSDLIFHEIKTKSVPDVCNYLSVLQLAASQQESTVSYFQRPQNRPIAMEDETAFDLTREQRELIAEQRRTELKLPREPPRLGRTTWNRAGVRPNFNDNSPMPVSATDKKISAVPLALELTAIGGSTS